MDAAQDDLKVKGNLVWLSLSALGSVAKIRN